MKGADVFQRIAMTGEAEAEKAMLAIEVLANIIAEKMHFLHGDGCRVQVDHSLGFVMVVVRSN